MDGSDHLMRQIGLFDSLLGWQVIPVSFGEAAQSYIYELISDCYSQAQLC